MKTARVVVSVWVVVGCGLAAWGRPSVPREEIPADAPASVAEQIERLYSEDAGERVEGARRLKEMGPGAEAAAPFLVDLLGDQEPVMAPEGGRADWAAAMAADALERIGGAAVEALVGGLRHSDEAVRVQAARVLGKLRDRRSFEPLVAALEDASPRAAGAAAEALGELGDGRAIEPLLRLAEHEHGAARGGAIRALAAIGDERAVPVLVKAVGDESAWIGGIAVRQLGRRREPRGAAAIARVLASDEREGWRDAAEALGKIGGAEAEEALLSASRTDDRGRRAAAARGLGW